MSLPSAQTTYCHVEMDPNGIPIIAGTTMKVVEIVMDKIAYGWSPEELHFQHPHLSLGQIHSALAYYWDHQEAFDRDIRDRLEKIERIKRSLPASPLRAKLASRSHP